MSKTRSSKLIRYFADPDGRVRTSYFITGTESDRTSTSLLGPPERANIYGLSFQTINKHSEEGREIRSMFVPAVGNMYIEVDKSQAESRIALLLAKEYSALDNMDKIDDHILKASWIAGHTYEEELALYKSGYDENRQVGKHSGHAYDNGVGKKRLAEMIDEHSNHRIQISEWKAQKILDILYQNRPGIKDVFHREIQECLRDNGCTIRNPFDRKRTFFNKFGEEMFKEAYADIKQSTVIGSLQRNALEIHERLPEVMICVEWHDSLLLECRKEDGDRVIPIVKECFEREIDFSRCSLPRRNLLIPCEIKVSYKNWVEMTKVKI